MNKSNNQSGVISSDNKTVLREVRTLLSECVGNKITFNQFTGIMDKDNTLRFYNRNSMLNRRKKFFKREENKRGKASAKEIFMPLGKFVDFLDSLACDRKIRFDLEKLKQAIIYCRDIGAL